METTLEPHQHRIQRIGKLLSIFVTIWLVINLLSMLLTVTAVVSLKVFGESDAHSTVVEVFTETNLVPGVDDAILQQILEWDYDGFLQHFWLTLFLAVFSSVYFIVTMVLILRIARSMKAGDLLNESAINSLHLLGWLYLIQGIVGQAWGILGQFIATSNTCELLYFSFIRDTALYGFSFSGSGIEWGMLALAISYILKHARILRDEQMLVV